MLFYTDGYHLERHKLIRHAKLTFNKVDTVETIGCYREYQMNLYTDLNDWLIDVIQVCTNQLVLICFALHVVKQLCGCAVFNLFECDSCAM